MYFLQKYRLSGRLEVYFSGTRHTICRTVFGKLRAQKNAPMGEPMVPPWIPPPSDARVAGGPGLKDSYFYSNEVYSTRTGEKVA